MDVKKPWWRRISYGWYYVLVFVLSALCVGLFVLLYAGEGARVLLG